jgi:hypothetical protein
VITVFCCYCQKFLYEKDGQGITGRNDGICEFCLSKVMEGINEGRDYEHA